MKTRAAFATGAGFGQGGGILSGKSSEQSMSWMQELKTGKVESRELQYLLSQQGGDTPENRQKVTEILKQQVISSGVSRRGTFDVTNGVGAYDKAIESVRNTKVGTKARTEAMLKFESQMADSGGKVGLSTAASVGAGIQDLRVLGIISQPEATKKLKQLQEAGAAAGIAPEAKALQKYIDFNIKDFKANKDSGLVTIDKYKQYLKKSGTEIQGITSKDVEDAEKDPTKRGALEKRLEGVNVIDLAQGAEQAYNAMGSNVQKVTIENWFKMGDVLLKMQNLGLKTDIGGG